MEKVSIVVVPYDSLAQKETIKLRDKVLRKPLGLVFFAEQLQKEKDDVHIAAYLDDKLVGCLLLHQSSNTHLKMRQVAVDPDCQKKGVGNQMIVFCHAYGRANNFNVIYCHARDTAKLFYEKNGYEVIGDSFEEVGLKHWKMKFEL